MPVHACRVCGGAFFAHALVRYENMPQSAQNLPDAESLRDDAGCDLDLCQCSQCGLIQLKGDPVPYWREVIRAAAFSPEMGAFRQAQFGRFVERFGLAGKKVVEIGCGRGEYLQLMGQAGAAVYGTEFGEASARHCAADGMSVERTFVEDASTRLSHAPFDGFFIMNFLEHLNAPCGTLRGIAANLADGAVGLVEVPNFDMILAKKLFTEFISDHLFYFTQNTLNALLQRCGFEIVETQCVWHDYIISSVVRKRSPLDLSAFQAQHDTLKRSLNDFVASFGARRVAVWGAGHQALAVLALADLGGSIRYVVDSAPFKQGRFTPASHLPIVPPEALVSDPVDAVLVMAAAYSDEVARTLRARFPAVRNIAVLRDFGVERICP